MTTKRVRIISIIIITYMIPALAWWTLLLYNKNEDVFAYQQIIAKELKDQPLPDYEALESKYLRQKYMILGEGLVFGLSLIIGIWIINRAIQDEFRIARLKNNFLLSVTHELKTPISSIKMVLQTLLNKPEIDEPIKQRISKNALAESNRLESMVNKLLLTTKIEDQYQYNFEQVELDVFTRRIIKNFPMEQVTHDITLTCPSELTAEIDQEAFQSVLLNLIENAVKYSKAPASIELIYTDQKSSILLEVKDQGIGIKDEEKQQILGKFYRVGDEEFRSTPGSGLGLFIVHSIISSHNGIIQFHDNKPKGTIVSIQFPKFQKSLSQ